MGGEGGGVGIEVVWEMRCVGEGGGVGNEMCRYVVWGARGVM